jgi:type I restriction enzyme, S subunit
MQKGTTRPRIALSVVRELPIAVPIEEEQQRVVGIPDEASDAIATAKANAEKNLQNARALFESHLHTIFAQGGAMWVKKRLSEIAESMSTGPFGTMLHRSDYVADGIPLVDPMNIVDSMIVPSVKMMVDEETRNRLAGYVLRAGDIVIGRRGESGRCALSGDREAGWLCGTGSFCVRLTGAMDGEFFATLFGSEQLKDAPRSECGRDDNEQSESWHTERLASACATTRRATENRGEGS